MPCGNVPNADGSLRIPIKAIIAVSAPQSIEEYIAQQLEYTQLYPQADQRSHSKTYCRTLCKKIHEYAHILEKSGT